VTRRELISATIALLATLAVGSALILIVHRGPGYIWLEMLHRVGSDPARIGQVLYRATALALTGLAVSIALDAGLFNIAGEAQLAAGVLACAVVGAALPAATPWPIAIPICALAAAAAGGLIGALIGIARVTRGAHEVITSIMLNEIVGAVVLWVGNAFLFENGTTTGPAIALGARLPQLIPGSSANVAIVFAAAAIVAAWWIRSRTTWGAALRAVGRDPAAARAVGISVGRVQIAAMTIAGALAGLAAINFVLGDRHAYEEGLGRGFGFVGLSAALLGRLEPVGIAIAALVLGYLSVGGLAISDLVPKELPEMLQGIVVIAIAIAVPWTRKRMLRRPA
jgi:simple sugar transport system permease protein